MKLQLCIVSLFTASATLQAQDYTNYNKLLKKHVKKDGINYKKWFDTAADKEALKTILSEWSKVDGSKLVKNQQAAFRTNLYNAAMIQVVLDNYPLKSVTALGKPFSIFDKALIQTPSGKISLNTLEKKRLLKDLPDARLHFAINCASVSCPPLRAEAYTAEALEAQLTEQATQFANSQHAVQIEGKTAKYSELFNWYAKDFGTTDPASYLNTFRSKAIDSKLKKSWIKYDWNLNASK